MSPIGQSVPDLSHLSDAELSQLLKGYGVNVGPINAATRRTYERRLLKLQSDGDAAPRSQVVNDVDHSVDEDITASSVEQELSISTADVATSPYHQFDAEHGNTSQDITASSVEQELSVSTADVATSPYCQSENERGNTNQAVVKEKHRSVKTTIAATPSRHWTENNKEVLSREKYEERSVKPTVATAPARHWPQIDKEEIPVRHPEPSSRPIPVLTKIPQPVMSKVREREFFSPIESRPSLPINRRTPVPRATPITSYAKPSRPALTKLPQEKRTEYPAWLPLLVVAIAVILGYLIYANMEPAAKSNIPGGSNKIEV
ncbi:hypothetical protein BsWGS_13371 [Bradybaena similaris]